jgi:decaprenylphospho-beta-D-erythro-pentofuranosid-2-ulose 2-reductase
MKKNTECWSHPSNCGSDHLAIWKTGHKLFFIAKNEEWLAAMIKDLKIRGASEVSYCLPDVNDFSRHTDLFDRAMEALVGIDTALIAHGAFPNQKACKHDFDLTRMLLARYRC